MNNPNAEGNSLQHDIDALVEFVHRGCAKMLDVNEVLSVISSALQPNSSMNYEYRFAWSDTYNPDALDINWKRLKKRILRRAVTDPERCESILAGAEMTAKEKEAYRLELARKEHGYKTGERAAGIERRLQMGRRVLREGQPGAADLLYGNGRCDCRRSCR